jgi:NADPH:quinone reductase-like Zn-dependent oxidoreductase
MGVQLAKTMGASTFVVTATSGAANIALVKALGADLVIDDKEQEIFDALADNSVDIVRTACALLLSSRHACSFAKVQVR